MMVSPAASIGVRLVIVESVIAPAGTISHSTRGAFSFATSCSNEAADPAPFCSRAVRASAAGSNPTTVWPPRSRRCAMLAPMRPKPIIAICMMFDPFARRRRTFSIDPGTRRGTAGYLFYSGALQHDHDRGASHRFEAARELQRAGGRDDTKGGDRVASLVARIEKLARRIKGHASRVVGVDPDIGNHPQLTVGRHRKNGHGVVQSIRHIQESAVCGD